jgi:hypothetical protein
MNAHLTKKIRQWERQYIPNHRKKNWYIILKVIVLMPIILIGTGITLFKNNVIKVMRFERDGKPDVVLENIIAGWSNLIFGNPAVEEMAIKRAKICAECPSAQFSGGIYYLTTIDQKTKQVRGLSCGECGCALSAKVRSVGDTCPLGKW